MNFLLVCLSAAIACVLTMFIDALIKEIKNKKS